LFATRCQILRLKCTKFDFGWGSAPDPVLGELTALPQLDLKDPTSNGRGEEEGQGSEGEGRVFSLYLSICGLKNVLENFSWGSWKVLDFLSVKEWEP